MKGKIPAKSGEGEKEKNGSLMGGEGEKGCGASGGGKGG